MLHPRIALFVGATLFAVPAPGQNVGVTLTNGVDGYLEVPYAAQVVPQGGITVEAWLTYDESTLPSGWRYPTVVRQGLAANSENYFLRVNADNSGARVLRWKVVTANGTQLFANWPFAAGQLTTWTHVAATYDGTTSVLYVNGAPVASANGNGQPIRDTNDVLRIGKGSDVGGPIEVWNGQLDEVRLWPFARTQAEIQQTMQLELSSVPGLVSTWNLNGTSADSSGSRHATSSGSVVTTANTLALANPSNLPGIAFGASTPGCRGPLAASIGSLPVAGNLAFAPVCTRTVPNGTAFLLMSLGSVSSPLRIVGIDVWLDVPSSSLMLATTNALGAVRFPMPVPANVRPGLSFAVQFGCVDPCGPQGFTASDAIGLVTQ